MLARVRIPTDTNTDTNANTNTNTNTNTKHNTDNDNNSNSNSSNAMILTVGYHYKACPQVASVSLAVIIIHKFSHGSNYKGLTDILCLAINKYMINI